LIDGDCFDAMVVDLGLPDLPGYEVARRALKQHPNIGVIFATGYDGLPSAAKRDGLASAITLQKPYDDRQIADALKAATSRRNGGEG
jgi:FixJ family two-component response regulator